MESTLMKYEALSASQRSQVQQIELLDEQKTTFGDIHGALHGLTARPFPDIQGYVLLVEDVPRGFFLLKRRTLLPAWAQGRTATLHALIIDHRYQGLGLGHTCLRLLPTVVPDLWPEIEQLMLTVHPTNHAALALYQAAGWAFSDDTVIAAAGFERRMVRRLP